MVGIVIRFLSDFSFYYTMKCIYVYLVLLPNIICESHFDSNMQSSNGVEIYVPCIAFILVSTMQ